MPIIYQEDCFPTWVPCLCLGKEALFKPLSHNKIVCPPLVWQGDTMDMVSHCHSEIVTDHLQHAILLKISFVEDIHPSENKAWLQAWAISGNTFNCCDEFKVSTLCPYAVSLVLREHIAHAIELPPPTQLNPFLIHIIHVLWGYVVLL